jgi:zinc D-Ala-D-Ala carboxypeptidase
MRVVEPKQFSQLKRRKKMRVLPVLLVLLVAGGAGGYYCLKVYKKPAAQNAVSNQTATQITNDTTVQQTQTSDTPKKLKILTDADFKQLYLSIGYPNVQPISETLQITGNADADARIRKLAEARGYRRGSIPVASIQKTQEKGLEGDDLLQPLALTAWEALRDSAKRESIPVKLNSAYRSIEYQRELFTGRLYGRGASIASMVAGTNDGAINATLEMTAPPGYSRHHTGYTIDLRCEDGSLAFITSSCFAWMKKNNYENAKMHGWIPSYPEEVEHQGPEPEAWEYVWVGTDVLYE